MTESFMLSDQTVIEAAKQQVSCGLASEAVILGLQSGVYYGVNSAGARIWELLKQPRTVAEIRLCLLQEFDVEPSRCAQDLASFLEELLSHGLIEICHGKAAHTPSAPAD